MHFYRGPSVMCWIDSHYYFPRAPHSRPWWGEGFTGLSTVCTVPSMNRVPAFLGTLVHGEAGPLLD